MGESTLDPNYVYLFPGYLLLTDIYPALINTFPLRVNLCNITLPQIAALYMLNRFLGTQSHVDSQNTIWAEPQYMTGKFHAARR